MSESGTTGWGEYINDLSPRDDWWRASRYFPEYFGQVFRLRGLLTLGTAHLGTIGSMLLANADWRVILAFAIPATLLLVAAVYVRTLLIATCEADAAIHLLMHRLRDRLNDVVTSGSPQARLRAVKDLYADVCQQIAYCFRHRTGDAQLACCIRVMQVNDQGKEQFVTCGRSDGLAPGREATSEPIGANEGIVRAFLERGADGAYRIDDLQAAERARIWKGTPNDNNFQDIKRVLVCPVNGFYDGKKRMLALLYLTSRSQPIQQIYWNALEAVAGALGAVLPLLYGGEGAAHRQAGRTDGAG